MVKENYDIRVEKSIFVHVFTRCLVTFDDFGHANKKQSIPFPELPSTSTPLLSHAHRSAALFFPDKPSSSNFPPLPHTLNYSAQQHFIMAADLVV